MSNVGRVFKAIGFKASIANGWIAIAKSTAWTDDNSPPLEVGETTSLDGPIGYKKIATLSLAKEDSVNGAIKFRTRRFTLVNDTDAYTQSGFFVFISAEIEYDELPLTPYRQVGLYDSLVAIPAKSNSLVLLPSEVQTLGKLIAYSNDSPHNRAVNEIHAIEEIIEVL